MISNARAALLAEYGFARDVGEIVTDFKDHELAKLCKKARKSVDKLQALVTEARILRGKRQALRLVLGKLEQRYDEVFNLLGPDELDRLTKRKNDELERHKALQAHYLEKNKNA
jgi:hypothetical protein